MEKDKSLFYFYFPMDSDVVDLNRMLEIYMECKKLPKNIGNHSKIKNKIKKMESH